MPKQRAPRKLAGEDWKNIRNASRRLLHAGEILEHERPDIEQELALTLWQESRKFKSRRSSWASFSYVVLTKRLRKITRDRNQPSSRYRGASASSLNVPIPDSEDSDLVSELIDMVNTDGLLEDGTGKAGAEQILLKVDMEKFKAGLPTDLRDICDRLATMRLKDVSEALGISRTTLYKKIKKIRGRMIVSGLWPTPDKW